MMVTTRRAARSTVGPALRLVGLLGSCLAVTVAPTPVAAANAALKAAQEAAAAKEYEVALRWSVQALRETSDARVEVKIFTLMAAVYSRTGRANQATDMYFEILVRQPDFDLPQSAPAEQRAALVAARVATRPPAGAQPDAPDPTSSDEQPTTNEAARLFAAAQVAYENLDYEKVMPTLRQALDLETTPELETQIFALMAYLNMSQGRTAQAKKSFVRVLEGDPDFALPQHSSPKLVAALDTAREDLDSARAPAAPETLAPATHTCARSGGTTAPPPDLSMGPCGDCDALYNAWWFWTLVGVAVAGGAIGATFAISQTGPVPPHNYGPIELR